jgi:hypothetical protein
VRLNHLTKVCNGLANIDCVFLHGIIPLLHGSGALVEPCGGQLFGGLSLSLDPSPEGFLGREGCFVGLLARAFLCVKAFSSVLDRLSMAWMMVYRGFKNDADILICWIVVIIYSVLFMEWETNDTPFHGVSAGYEILFDVVLILLANT